MAKRHKKKVRLQRSAWFAVFLISAIGIALGVRLYTSLSGKVLGLADSKTIPVDTSPLPTGEDAFFPDEIIVRFREDASENTRKKVHQQVGGLLKKNLPRINAEVVGVPKGKKPQDLISKYKGNPNIKYAERNGKMKAIAITNDPFLTTQYGLYKMGVASSVAPSAWDTTTGSTAIKIAILDTGIEEMHPDLAGKVVARVNFSTSVNTYDYHGHGTHVAGIAAVATNNGIGVAGVGYRSLLLNVKVLNDGGYGSWSSIAQGITWAADNGAKVINMSLGGSVASFAIQDAVNYAWSKNVVLIASAGNGGTALVVYPAYYDKVIAVGATDDSDSKTSWSSYGSWVDVAAPGDTIYSTYKNKSYAFMKGTSMASPHAAGVAALVWAKGACTSNACVRSTIETTADQVNGTGMYWTWGRVNAQRALALAVPTPTPTSTPTPKPTRIPTPTPIPYATSSPFPTPKLSPTPKPTYYNMPPYRYSQGYYYHYGQGPYYHYGQGNYYHYSQGNY